MLDPKVAETLQFLHDLIHVDKVSPIPGKDTMDNQFDAGQVAMISRGHWIIENAKKAKLDMDVADVPSKVNGNTVIGFGGYGVSKTSKNPELAKELVGALTSEETQKEEGELGGGVPGRKSAAETPASSPFRRARRSTTRRCRTRFPCPRRRISRRSKRSSCATTWR